MEWCIGRRRELRSWTDLPKLTIWMRKSTFPQTPWINRCPPKQQREWCNLKNMMPLVKDACKLRLITMSTLTSQKRECFHRWWKARPIRIMHPCSTAGKSYRHSGVQRNSSGPGDRIQHSAFKRLSAICWWSYVSQRTVRQPQYD